MAFQVFQLDNLRSSSQIICSTIWGSFPVWRSFAALRGQAYSQHAHQKAKKKNNSQRNKCDIGFSWSTEVQRGIHSSGSGFVFNRIAKGKLNEWAKPDDLFFCEPCQRANSGHPFKVSCQDLANRIFRMKITFISTSWKRNVSRFTVFSRKFYYFQSQFDTN